MSKVIKQNSVSKTLLKDDKLRTTTKTKSNTSKDETKPKRSKDEPTVSKRSKDDVVTKRKVVNGVSSTADSKTVQKQSSMDKIEKKSTKPTGKIGNGKANDVKTKVEAKTANGRSEKLVKKEPSIEKATAKHDKSDQIRSKDKVSSKPVKKTPTKPVEASKSEVLPSKSKPASNRPVPMKASHSIGAKSIAATTISSKNIMNQVHNVTVSSPPPVRREIATIDAVIERQRSEEAAQQPQNPLPRGRTRTRTLEDDEIVLLKPKPTEPVKSDTQPELAQAVEIKPPISFEVKVSDEPRRMLSKKPEPVMHGEDATSDNEDYEDDFETYESDFESDVSDAEDSDSETSESQETISSGESESDDNVVSTASKHPFETGHSFDNSEFDSGSFELKVLSARKRERKDMEAAAISRRDQQLEVQNDSGIENISNTFGGIAPIPIQNGPMNSLDLNNKTFDNISDIENDAVNSLDTNRSKANSGQTKAKSRLARRGEEILSKITLDVMNYVLFDFKPIPYDLFMKIYGNSNTTQATVQTHNNRIDQECQSEAITVQNSWTQYPVSFYSQHMGQADFSDYKNGCGSEKEKHDNDNVNLERSCEYSLNLIRNMSFVEASRIDSDVNARNIDYEHLHRFLVESEMTMSRILNKPHRQLNEPVLPYTSGFLRLNTSFNAHFESTKVQRIFVIASLPGFLFTLHRDQSSELNMLIMWNLAALSTPVCLLSVWSKVVCLEIHPKIKDIVFAGLDDGSIAVWDYSESKHWHPGLSEEIKRFVPSHITTPTFDNKDMNDFGSCISIRALPIATDTELLNGYNPKQICSLHEFGLLILWTVLGNTSGVYSESVNRRIDHQSLWGKVKLIQNKAIDLRASVRAMPQLKMSRPNSKSFDKTRSYFESGLFNDAALQELHLINAGEEKILTNFRCTAIELTRDGILISTNENFLLFGRKSFKSEAFRRIQIDANKNIRVECMVSLSGFDDDIVIVALNNGAVKSLCCSQSIDLDESQTNSDIDECSSPVPSLPPTVQSEKAPNSNIPINFGLASPSNGPVQVATAAPLQAGFFSDSNASSFGKSCTIQSLVRNEREIYDGMQALNHLENAEYKKTLETVPIMPMQRTIRSTHLMSGQTILTSSAEMFSLLSSQFLVQLTTAKKLITLRKNQLHIYDLLTNQVVEMPANQTKLQRFVEATTTTADLSDEYLILLNTVGVVELHQIAVDPNN